MRKCKCGEWVFEYEKHVCSPLWLVIDMEWYDDYHAGFSDCRDVGVRLVGSGDTLVVFTVYGELVREYTAKEKQGETNHV